MDKNDKDLAKFSFEKILITNIPTEKWPRRNGSSVSTERATADSRAAS